MGSNPTPSAIRTCTRSRPHGRLLRVGVPHTQRAAPTEWYTGTMSGTYEVVVGDRGRMVVPVEVRERTGIAEGTTLVLLETPNGLVLLTRDQLRRRVREDLAGVDLVADLLADRRASSAAEDAA